MTMKEEPITFQWQEETISRYGDGVSHPKKGVKTKPFKILVRNGQMAAMKVELRAESKTAAINYGKARWPNAVIEVIK